MRDARNLNDIYAIPLGERVWGERITVYADTSARNGTYEFVYNSNSTRKSDNLNWKKVGSADLIIMNGVSFTQPTPITVANGTLFAAIPFVATVSVLMDNGATIALPITYAIGTYDKDVADDYTLSGTVNLTNYPYISVSALTITVVVTVSA